jgi:hypothetical protein
MNERVRDDSNSDMFDAVVDHRRRYRPYCPGPFNDQIFIERQSKLTDSPLSDVSSECIRQWYY